MPALFLPEERWGPGSWGSNHPLTVRAQIHHGMTEASYGYWGFSPANIPEGGYSVYGVDAIGMDPNGNPSNEDRTLADHGYAGCPNREPQPDPPASAYTNGVVTPHAAFLGLRWAPGEAIENLRRLERDFPGVYGDWGFRDTVNVDSGFVSEYYLSLDQGMVMAAIGNALGGDMLRRAFVTRATERSVRPVIGVEEFNSDPRGCTITGTHGDDRLGGTSRDDVICGLGGDDRVDGGAGNDAVFGDAGEDASTSSRVAPATTASRAAPAPTITRAARGPTAAPTPPGPATPRTAAGELDGHAPREPAPRSPSAASARGA